MPGTIVPEKADLLTPKKIKKEQYAIEWKYLSIFFM